MVRADAAAGLRRRLTGQYVDFTAAQRAALVMVGERAGVPLSADDIDGLVELMSSLPPHPEVRARWPLSPSPACAWSP